MNGTFPDGFPKDPYQAVDFSYFLSDQEKQEWREWIPNANQASQQELVETLHEIWKENQKSAVPDGFDNNLGGNQPASAPQVPAATPFAPQNNYTQPAQPPYTPSTSPQNYNQPATQTPLNPAPATPANQAFMDQYDPFGGPINTPTPQTAYTPPSAPYNPPAPSPIPVSAPTPAPIPADPFPPLAKPAPVQPAPTAINVPPFTPPPMPEEKPTNNHVNEFYFPGQNGSDAKTTITPPKTQPAPVQTKAPEPKKETPSEVNLPKTQSTAKIIPEQEQPVASSTNFTQKSSDNNSGQAQNKNDNSRNRGTDSGNREDTADRQLMRNQLSLLEKLTRSFGRMEKTLEEIKDNQTKQPEAAASVSLGQTAQKIQKDTGSLSSMVNTLYDEMAILRTMVQNQQDQIRTLNAHIQQFYTQPDRKLPIPQAQEIPQAPTINPGQVNPTPAGNMGYMDTQNYQNGQPVQSTPPINNQNYNNSPYPFAGGNSFNNQ